MNHKIFLLIGFFLFSVALGISAQEKGGRADSQKKADFEEFKAKRVEYISKEMGLTQTESQAFWPLCNELQEKKFELNRSMRGELRAIHKDLKAGKTVSEADYDKVINLNFDTKIKEAELEKTYYEKFRKILSADKVFKYQRAEQKFARKMFGNSGDTKNERKK